MWVIQQGSWSAASSCRPPCFTLTLTPFVRPCWAAYLYTTPILDIDPHPLVLDPCWAAYLYPAPTRQPCLLNTSNATKLQHPVMLCDVNIASCVPVFQCYSCRHGPNMCATALPYLLPAEPVDDSTARHIQIVSLAGDVSKRCCAFQVTQSLLSSLCVLQTHRIMPCC